MYPSPPLARLMFIVGRRGLAALMASPVLPSGKEERMALVSDCMRVNELHSIKRFPSYETLAEMASWFRSHPTGMLYLGDQFIVDLLVWYHMASSGVCWSPRRVAVCASFVPSSGCVIMLLLSGFSDKHTRQG